MADRWHFILVLAAALGSGLVAGVFYAFSTFVMRALARLAPAQGIAAMQSINAVVINPWFLGVFIGTAALSLAAAASAIYRWGTPGAAWLLAGGILYFAGSFVVTMRANVPMNE
ncbi:MAG TPA: anthrone oxygenase family protein, partial [Burkholderiales bacterium]